MASGNNVPMQVELSWLRDQSFVALDSDGMSILIDNPQDDNARRGPSPMSLLLMSLAGCTAIDIVAILEKQRQELDRLDIQVSGERAEDHPRRFTRIQVSYTLSGPKLDPKKVDRAVKLSDEKYCSVAASLREPVEIESRFEIAKGEA